MRVLPIFLALLAATAGGAELRCEKKPPRGATVRDITLAGPRHTEGATPVFYVHAEPLGLLIFLRPADVKQMITEIDEAAKGAHTTQPYAALAAEIDKDLPLREHTDLGKYAFRKAINAEQQDVLVSEMLMRGRASVGDWSYFEADSTGKITSSTGVSWPIYNYDLLRMYTYGREEEPDARKFCLPQGLELLAIQYTFE